MKWQRFPLWIVLLAFLATTVACRTMALHQGLDEAEAEEIMGLLHDNGIEASKELEESNQNQAATWKIMVKKELTPQARQILIAHNLPRKKELGLSGVYKEKGLIPTPDEQKARFLLALKGEIINSLHKIPGVVDVDVVLNVPDQDEFSTTDVIQKRPTASVIVRTTKDENTEQILTESKLQKFVANTIPNMDPNDVAVIISRTSTSGFGRPNLPAVILPSASQSGNSEGLEPVAAESVNIGGVNVDSESAGRFKFYLVAFLMILMGLSSFLIFNVLRLNRMKMKVQKGTRSGAVPLAAGQGNPNLLSGQGGNEFNTGNTGAFDTTFNAGNQGPGTF